MSHCEPRQNEHEELTTKNQRDDKREDNERETADAKQLTRNNEREANANNRRACHARTSARVGRVGGRIMAVPKKKMSRSRTRRRKAVWKVSPPTVTTCTNCDEPVLPHRACKNCGTYRGRPVGETASA